MYLKLLFVSVCSLIFIHVSTFAQENVLKPRKPLPENPISTANSEYSKINFGLEAGVNYNMFSQTLTWSDEIPNSIFNVFEKASGLAPYVAAIIDFPVSDNKLWGFQVKLAYEGRAYDNSYTGLADCQDLVSGLTFDAEQNNVVEITGADFGLSALLRYNISNELVFTAGPMALIPIGNYSQTLTSTILSEECFFNFGTEFQSKVQEISSEVGDVKTRFGIDLGLSYMIPLSESVMLAPTVRLNYMFTNIGENSEVIDDTRFFSFGDALLLAENSKLHALKFGLGLWF